MGGAPSKAEPRVAKIERGFAELIAADYENLQQQVTRQYERHECNSTTDPSVRQLCQRYKQRYLEVLKILNQYRNLDPLQVLYQLDDIIANFDSFAHGNPETGIGASEQPIVDAKIAKLKRLLLIEEVELLKDKLDQAASSVESANCDAQLQRVAAELDMIVQRLVELSQRASRLG